MLFEYFALIYFLCQCKCICRCFWLVDVGGAKHVNSPPILIIMIHDPNRLPFVWSECMEKKRGSGDGFWSQVEFQDTMEQGYPAGERAIEGFLIHFDYGALASESSQAFLV